MVHVSDLCALPPTALGEQLQVSGILLGGGISFFLASSVEDFDRSIAVTLVDDELFERLFVHGVFAVGGGRFGFSLPCVIEAELGPSARGYKYSLKNIVSLTVTYSGKDVSIVPGNEPKQ